MTDSTSSAATNSAATNSAASDNSGNESRQPRSRMGKAAMVAGLAGGALILSACSGFDVDFEYGSVELETRTFELAAFNAVDVDAVYDVEIIVEEGAAQSVTIEADVNKFDDLSVVVENGVLELDMSNAIHIPDDLTVMITVPELAAVTADGATSVTIEGTGGDLSLSVDGVSSIDAGDYLADSVEVKADGASDVEVAATGSVTGSAEGIAHIEIREAGSIDVDAEFAASVDRP